MVRVKICGLTTLDDARCALEAGADLLGFIFHPPSPRYVSPETVAHIVSHLRAEFAGQTFQSVGVFVNRPAEKVNTTLKEASLDLAQLHGDEGEFYFDEVAPLKGRVFKAINPRTLAEAETAAQRFLRPEPGFILVDAWHPTLRGGTGHVADWSLAGSLAQQVPLLLAGGLTPANVAEAVAQVQPWGVDVSSGVEASKGRKDHAAVRAFVAAAKSS